MSKPFCRNKYKLELYWDNITYQNDQIALLTNARFSGPALKNAAQITAPDFIDLDLTDQLIYVLDTYYIIRLSWQGVRYEDGLVKLDVATLGNKELKQFHKLSKEDHILINTEKHEEKTHAFNLVYSSTIMRPEGHAYAYNKG